MEIGNEDIKKFVEKARGIVRNSYSPYSKIRVAACLICEEGEYWGVNVENASYGLTICAERTAVFNAMSSGARNFIWMLVYSPDIIPVPCGACRQVIAEFTNPDFLIVVVSEKGGMKVWRYRISELLPQAFKIE